MIDLSTIEGAVLIADGIPRPQWDVIAPWIEEHSPAEQHQQVWTAAAEQWLAMIRATWGEPYAAHRSQNFLALTADRAAAREVLEFCETALYRIKAALPETASDAGFGPHVIILCADHAHYYDYVCYFDVDGDWATSGGMFIDRGYGHIVMPPSKWGWREVVAHELAHSLLRHLPLPCWLNEGLAQSMEEIVMRRDAGWPPIEDLYRLREFWPERGIQDFWRGDSFHDAEGEGQELSYLLARVILRRLAQDHPNQLLPFIRETVWEDAGDAAAQVHFKRGIGPIVGEILGDGDWKPNAITFDQAE